MGSRGEHRSLKTKRTSDFQPGGRKKKHGFRENDKNLKLANCNKRKVVEIRNSVLGIEM